MRDLTVFWNLGNFAKEEIGQMTMMEKPNRRVHPARANNIRNLQTDRARTNLRNGDGLRMEATVYDAFSPLQHCFGAGPSRFHPVPA
jgi:hypothetical protein